MSRMTCLSFVFPSKPPRRTSLKINSEMAWLYFSFQYKRLNMDFTIKLFFEIRTSHYVHALAFSCKTPNIAGDPAPGCTSLFTAHRSRLAIWSNTVYPKKYAHGFVVLCFVVVMKSFIMNSHEVFIHIHQGCFAGTGAIVRLPQCQWSKPDGYGKISQCITTTKHSKANTVCIFLGIYCTNKYTHCEGSHLKH